MHGPGTRRCGEARGRCFERRLAAGGAQATDTVRQDYADYSPASLVVRKFGWAEEALRSEEAAVQWVRAGGSKGARA